MNFGEVAFLGVLQGITEFFPISSSGHLLLAEHFFSLDVEHLKAFDVVLHGGTLLALLVLFWREWRGITVGVWQMVFGKVGKDTADNFKLLLRLIMATIPAAAVGLSFNHWIDEFSRGEQRVMIVAGFFVLVAALLLLAEWVGKKTARSEKLQCKNVILMGVSQAFALLPGVSRSGITIATGMLTGLSRSAAAKFSFLMLAPVTAGAVLLISREVWGGELTLPPLGLTALGFCVSAVSSFIFASLLLRLVKKHSLAWFSAYLVLAAAVLIFIQ